MKTVPTFGLLMAAALLGAPTAAADPEILEPYCSEGQVPTTGECKPAPNEAYINNAPGADPDVAVGLDPESVPAI
jgi:hypothetical protein